MTEQHAKKWSEYLELRKDKTKNRGKLQTYFSQTEMAAFFPKKVDIVGSDVCYFISKEVIEDVVGRIFLEKGEERAGDIAMKAYKPVRAEEGETVVGYSLRVKNPLQFEWVTSLLAAGLSFAQCSVVVREAREKLGVATKVGYCSAGEVASIARNVCAVGLQLVSELLDRSWAFSIGSDVSTDKYGDSYLDICIRTPPVDHELLSFHVIAIPLKSDSHSGEVLFERIAQVLTALCANWRKKLIGSSTDGAPSMTGRFRGVSTRLQDEVSSAFPERPPPFYRVWCTAHQLDLVVKSSVVSISKTVGFNFLQVMTTLVGHLRQQKGLIAQMGSKCPYYIDVRWTSMGAVTKWLAKHHVRIRAHLSEKSADCAPPALWWAMLFVVNSYLAETAITLRCLQEHASTVSQHTTHLNRLIDKICQAGGAKRNPSGVAHSPSFVVSESGAQMGMFSMDAAAALRGIRSISVPAMELADSISQLERGLLLSCTFALHLTGLNGVQGIVAERDKSNDPGDFLPPVLPLELAELSAVDAVELTRSHAARVQGAFDEAMVVEITDEHKELVSAVARESALRKLLLKKKDLGFASAWGPLGDRFKSLKTFASGIATVMPTTAAVESDFSKLGYEKNDNRTAISNFSLEGVLHARQFPRLMDACKHLGSA